MNKSSPIIIVVFCFWLACVAFTLFFHPPKNNQKTNINFYLELSVAAPIVTFAEGMQAIKSIIKKEKARQYANDFNEFIDPLDINFPPEQKTIKSPKAYEAQHKILDKFTTLDKNTRQYRVWRGLIYNEDFIKFLLKYNDISRTRKIIFMMENYRDQGPTTINSLAYGGYKNYAAYTRSILALSHAQNGQCQMAKYLIRPIFENNIINKRSLTDRSQAYRDSDIIFNIFFIKLLCASSENATEFLISYDYSLMDNIHEYKRILEKLAIILNNQNNIELSLKVLKEAENIYDENIENKYANPSTYLIYKAIGQEDELSKIIKKRSKNPNSVIHGSAKYYLQNESNSFKHTINFILKHDNSVGRLASQVYFLKNNINHPDFKNAIKELISDPLISKRYGHELINFLELYFESHSENEIWALIENKGFSAKNIDPISIIPALISKGKFTLLNKYLAKHYEAINSEFNKGYPICNKVMAAIDTLNYTHKLDEIKQYETLYEATIAFHNKCKKEHIIPYLVKFGYIDIAIELQMQERFQKPDIWIEILEQNMAKLEPQVNFEAELTEEAFLRQFSDYE